MLTLQYLRSNQEDAVQRLAKKHFDAKDTVGQILSMDASRRQLQAQLDQLLAGSNTLSKEIGQLFSQGKKQEAEEKRNQSIQFKEDAKKLEERMRGYEEELHQLLVRLPNVPNDAVPEGKTPEENVVVRSGENTANTPSSSAVAALPSVKHHDRYLLPGLLP